MRRRTKDPKKVQEVFLFALEALDPFWGTSAIANNAGSNVLTKAMIHDMLEKIEATSIKPPDWVVHPEAMKDLMEDEWSNQYLDPLPDV